MESHKPNASALTALLDQIYQPGRELTPGMKLDKFYGLVLEMVYQGLSDSFYEDPPNTLQQGMLTLLKDTAEQLPGFYDLPRWAK